jgi:polyribonucleotide nucleotidyltransferase
VINALQQETGADINVDDDGITGRVTIGGRDGAAVAEARRRIELILDPPKAQVGATYRGRVVNVTKFGAFVNILPGRDGLVHISKLGRGKRVDKVEDVVDLGDEVEVHVDDIDPQGKVSLSLAGDPPEGASGRDAAPEGEGRGGRPSRSGGAVTAAPLEAVSEVVSFEETWEAEAAEAFGDLGPAATGAPAGGGGERDDNGPRRNPRRRR